MRNETRLRALSPALPLLVLGGVPAATAQISSSELAAQDDRVDTQAPITIIVLDDADFPTWNAAHKPNIDALASRGIRFTQAWGYPVCSPARAALLTGRHAWRTGVGSNIGQNGMNSGLPLEEITLAELLPQGDAEAFGKWHVGHALRNPNDQGFAHYAGAMYNLDGVWGYGYERWMKSIDGSVVPEFEYATRDTTDDALRSGAPLRYVAYHAIHSPYHAPPGGSASDTFSQKIEMLEYVDGEIGRLIEGYGGWVFLMGDNNNAGQGIDGGGKGGVKETGIHIPFIVCGPGIADEVRGTISEDLVSIVDVFPTVAEIAGVPYSHTVDGISLVAIFGGADGERKLNYVEKFAPNGPPPFGKHLQAIRNAEYKLIVNGVKGTTALYSMPGEVKIPPPWTGDDLRAAAHLRGSLPQ